MAEQDRHFRMVLQALDGYERSLADLDAQLLPLVEAASRVGSEASNIASLRREADAMVRARSLLSRALETCAVAAAASAPPREFQKTALPRALFALFQARGHLSRSYHRIVWNDLLEAESKLPLLGQAVQPYIARGCSWLYGPQLSGRAILQMMLKRSGRGLLAVTPAGQTADQEGQAVAEAVSAIAASPSAPGGPGAGERQFPRNLIEASWALVRQFLEFAHLSPYAPISMLCDTLAQAAGTRPPEFGETASASRLPGQGAARPAAGSEAPRGDAFGPAGAGAAGGWPSFSQSVFSLKSLIAQEASTPEDTQLLTSPGPGSEALTRDYAFPVPDAVDDQFVALNALIPLISAPGVFADCLAKYLEERRRGLLSPFAEIAVAGPCLSPRDATGLRDVPPLVIDTRMNEVVKNYLTNFLAQLKSDLTVRGEKLPDPQGIMTAVRFQEEVLSESLGARPDVSGFSKVRGFSPETTHLAHGRRLLAQRRDDLVRERAKERRKLILARDARSPARPSRNKYQPESHPFLAYLVCLVRNLITERQYIIRLFCSILCHVYQEDPEPGFLLPKNFPASQPGVFYSMCRLADACYQVTFYPAVRYAAQVGLDLARAMAEAGESCMMAGLDLVQNITALLPVIMFTGFTELASLTVGGLPLEYCPVSDAFALVTPNTNSPGSKDAVFVNGLGFVPQSYAQASAEEQGQKDSAAFSAAHQSVRWTGKLDPLSMSGSQGPATSTYSFDENQILQAQWDEDYVPINAEAVVGGQNADFAGASGGAKVEGLAASVGPSGPASLRGVADTWGRRADVYAQRPALAVAASLLALISSQARAERGFGDEDPAVAALGPALLGAVPGASPGPASGGVPGLAAGPAAGAASQTIFLLNPSSIDFYKVFSEPMATKPAFALTPLDLGRRELLYMCYVMSRAAFNLHNVFESTLFQIRTKVQDPNVHEQVPVILNKLEQMLSYTQGAALVPKQVSRGELVTQEVIESLEDQEGPDRDGSAGAPDGPSADSARPATAALQPASSGPTSLLIRDVNTGGEMLSPVPVLGAKGAHEDRSSPDFFSLDPYLAPQEASSSPAAPGWAGMLAPLAYECKLYYLACLMVYRVQPLRHPSQTYVFRINTLNYIYEYISSGSNELSAAVDFDFREFLRHQIDKLIKLYVARVWMPALTSLDAEALCSAIEHVYTKWYQQGNMGVTKEDYEHIMARIESSRAACRRGRANVGYVDAEGGEAEGDFETSVGMFAEDPELDAEGEGDGEAAGNTNPSAAAEGSDPKAKKPGLTAEALAAQDKGASGRPGAESVANSSRDSDATSDAFTSVAPVRQNTPKVTVPKSKRIQSIMSVALPKFDKIIRPLIEQHRGMFVSSSAVQERLRGHIQEAVVDPYKQYYAVCEMTAATSRYLQKYSTIRAEDLERAVGDFFR